MKIKLFQVDAFTDKIFSGNPAAVCPLDYWFDDLQLQAIAAENNLSETAFFVAGSPHYQLRWFTPTVEVQLCGHATLASAFVIFNYLEPTLSEVTFATHSGLLSVNVREECLTLDFPAYPALPCVPPRELARSLGQQPHETLLAKNYLAVFQNERQIRELKPDFSGELSWLGDRGIIVAAPGDSTDFVSRFFAPAHGIAEDPVTGSAHCTLAPYWSARLGKTALHARQISARGGELFCKMDGQRVLISGKAVLYLEGSITL